MSAKEYNLWIAEYSIEPYGQDREDVRSGMVVQSIRAQNSRKGVTLKDCIVNFEPPKKQTPADMFAMLKQHTASMGGKVK